MGNDSELEDRQQNIDAGDYEGRIKIHRLRTRGIIAAVIVIAIIVVVCVLVKKYRSGYGHYSVISSVFRTEGENGEYMPFRSGYIRYSRDGVSMYSYNGTQLWNRTYLMDSPIVDINGGYVVVADVKGNEYYLFDESGYITSVNTALPIMQARVSEQGLVVVTLEDSEAVYICMYDKSGGRVYRIKTILEGTGIPVAMDVSPNGEMLIVSYAALNNQKLSSSVVFYSFNEVGQNEVERIVAGYDTYGSQLIPKVNFISENRAYAIGEKVISFFKVTEYPKLITDIAVEGTICQVFSNDKNIGVVVLDETNTSTVIIYDANGNIVTSFAASDEYNRYALCKDGCMLYGSEGAKLRKNDGKIIFDKDFAEGISALYSIAGDDEYLVIDSLKIEKIKLKYGD